LFKEKKNKIISKYFIFIWIHNDKLENAKIGLIVSSKFYSSVERNRIKRIIRKAIVNYMDLTNKINSIIIVKKNILKINDTEVNEDFKHLFKKINIINKPLK